MTDYIHTKVCFFLLSPYIDQVQVQVVPPLRLIRPIDGHFLLPQNGEAKIVTNRDDISPLSYRLLQSVGGDSEGVIRVSHEGEISAAAVNGHAVVMVTDNEMDVGLNQSVVIHIEVCVWSVVCALIILSIYVHFVA